MSTRGAICFVVDGTEKVVYNHFDSYPEGLGEDVAAWLRDSLSDEDAVRASVRALRAVDGRTEPTPADYERLAEFHDRHVNRGDGWCALLHGTQGDPAEILRAGVFEDASGFQDSHSCRWVYVVNFDTRVFEVHGDSVAKWSFDALPELTEILINEVGR